VNLPNHLRLRIEVLSAAGEVLAQGRDIAQLQTDFRAAARSAFTERVGAFYNRDQLKTWPFDLPEQVNSSDGSVAYPALDDATNSVRLRAYATAAEAQAHHAGGVLRLLRLHLPDELRYWRKHISLSATAMLAYAATDAAETLREQMLESVLISQCSELASDTRTTADFQKLSEHARSQLGPSSSQLATFVDEVLNAYSAVLRKMAPPVIGLAKANLDDIRAQLGGLIYPKFVLEVPQARLAHYPRYLKAISVRLERLFNEPSKDQSKMLDLLPFMSVVESARHAPENQPLRWALEEFRVSVFAPELKTAEPVSVKRLRGLCER
jgi:ATP-dependent helicase HrpA